MGDCGNEIRDIEAERFIVINGKKRREIMKIASEELEKRNLGVETVSIMVEQNDTPQEVKKTLQEVQAPYLVLKIPTNRMDITCLASQYGYCYVEDMIFFEPRLQPIQRTPLQQRLYDAVKIEPMKEKDFDVLYEEINNGSFSFDRISNDPYFGQEIANRRFVNWIHDEKDRGAEFLKGTMKGEMTGFFTIRETEPGVYTSALGGTFMKWRKGGLGTNVQTPEEVKKRGGKKVVLGVSTNNTIQIRALIQNGYFPVKANHVFIKHCE